MNTSGTPLQALVGELVTGAMVAHGYTQKGLAEATHIPLATLRRKLAGAYPFNVAEIEAIAGEFGCGVSDFIGADGAA